MNIQIPAQRPAPAQDAATAAPAPVAVELGWGRVLRITVARASLALIASLVLWSLLPALVGWTPRVILSGSMEPRVHVGDIVVTRSVEPATLVKGQVITVTDPDHPGKTRTHRLLRRDADGTLVLKGDANRQADSSHVSLDAVQGLGVIRVPFVGRPAYWMAERSWLALGAATLFLGWCLVTALPGSRRSEDTPTDDSERPASGPGSPRRSRPRRVAATVAVAAFGVGIASGPADAAFMMTSLNPVSTLNAASTFYPYKTAVLADSPHLLWRLDETTGTAMSDSSGNGRAGTLAATGQTLGLTGALHENPNRALSLGSGAITANASTSGPSAFSVEAWVKNTSTTGGRILGFGNAGGSTGSSTIDRQLYMAPTGKVYFGIGSAKTTVASTNNINNGAWHHVVGTYTSGANGMKLYVDGALQGSATATPQSFTGYWRAAAEQFSGWAGNPTDAYYDGTLDELAVYTTALSAARVQAHYDAGVTP